MQNQANLNYAEVQPKLNNEIVKHYTLNPTHYTPNTKP